LAYQRIQNLVAHSNMTVSTATTQAEGEVLAALNIPFGNSYGGFGTLDISKKTDGDNILTAVSSIFTYGNSSGTLFALIANVQNEIGLTGVITDSSTISALRGAAQAIKPSVIAANLTHEYASSGITFTAADIGLWIDQDGDGLVGKYKFQVTDATQAATFTVPSSVASLAVGAPVAVSAGQLSVNGVVATAPVTVHTGDTIVLSPGTTSFGSNGVLTAYLMNGTQKLVRVSFISSTANVWSPAAPMVNPRTYHSATLLQNGQVLAVGGVGNNNAVYAGTELYDPVANTWAPGGSLAARRYLHTATILQNGKVLAVAGYTINSAMATLTLPSAEVYDSVANTWASAGNLATARIAHTATLIPSGQVLVVGGQDSNNNSLSSAEIYDPTSNSWTTAPSLSTPRIGHAATLLPNGLVLVSGGTNGGTTLGSAELYDPATSTWSPTGTMSAPRANHTATLLKNGMVLVAGGYANNSALAVTDLYNPTTNTWSAGGTMITARLGHAATLLPNGMLLVAGGDNNSGIPLASAEKYDPSTNIWSPAASLAHARGYFTATLLKSGAVLVAGGGTGSAVTDSAEVYW
jgi:N-acetylneuraminic acid mutarotase